MKKYGKSILGLPVKCLKKHCKLYEIKDLYCNQNFMVEYLLVQEGGYFHDAKVLPLKDVYTFSETDLWIQQSNSIIVSKELDDSISFKKQLLGVEVITQRSDLIGVVEDFIFDRETGKILGFILTESLFDDLADGRPILPVFYPIKFMNGKIVVSEKLRKNMIHKNGGFKKLLSLE